MPGEQDIISLGIDISSFSTQKVSTLRQFISLFNDLSKYDGKIFNPIMGDGLTTFNTSIATTSKLIDEMNVKLASLSSSNNATSSSTRTTAQATNELTLAMRQYGKQADQNAVIQSKLSVATSEQAQQNMALKLQLSETTKGMLDEAKASNVSIQNKYKQKAATEEYRFEQERVVATLRGLAIEQDRQSKSNVVDSENSKRAAAAAYRAEQERVVATLRSLAVEQDKKKANDLKESTQTKNLISDHEKLRLALKRQADEYVRLYLAKGKDNAATKAALADYASTATVINSVDKKLSSAGGGAAGFSRGLGTAFGHLRNIAYILPGLGIAGIFNLAFEAIGSVIDSLNLFENKENDVIETNIALNKSIAEQIKLYEELGQLRNTFYENFAAVSFEGKGTFGNLTDQKIDLDASTARGLSQDKLLTKGVSSAQKRFDNAQERILESGKDGSGFLPVNSTINNLKNQMQKILFDLGSANLQVERWNQIIAQKGKDGQGNKFDVDDAKLQRDLSSSQVDVLKSRYELLNGITKEYFDATNELGRAKNTLLKFNEDEERKLRFETAKNAVSLNIEKNKAILDDDRKFYEDRESAILKNYAQELSGNNAAFVNIDSNISTTPKERLIAQNTLYTSNQKALIKRDKELDKNKVEFYQRTLLATTEIQKDEIEQSAIAEERIFLNEKHTLKERLDSYENYIISKQKIKDLEHTLAIQRGAAEEGAATSLTTDEQLRIDVHRNTQKFNIQADAEKQTYNIVKSSLDDQIKLVEKFNSQEKDIDRDAYAAELNANNERFKNKIFQYNNFKKNKEFIDKKYGVILSIQDEIKDDEEDISRLKVLYEDLFKQKQKSDDELSKKRGDATDEKTKGGDVLNSERYYNEELGKNNAFNDAILKSKLDLDAAIKKGEDDKVAQAKARYEELIQFRKEHEENIRKIENDAWELASKLINRNVENELAAIELKTQARNEQSQLQLTAVEKSSLAEKDKTALEIQLTQQKLEADKQAALEERRIKHEAAVKDRELSIARVTASGIEAVLSALKLPPPAGEILAVERGILAGIALAQILAVPIPSYADGTEFHPGGYARFGEDGHELIKEPGKKPYIALSETVAPLQRGTQVIPLRDEYPEFNDKPSDDSWAQTKFLAKQISKNNKEIKNVFKPTIIIDMDFESRKRQILGN